MKRTKIFIFMSSSRKFDTTIKVNGYEWLPPLYMMAKSISVDITALIHLDSEFPISFKLSAVWDCFWEIKKGF